MLLRWTDTSTSCSNAPYWSSRVGSAKLMRQSISKGVKWLSFRAPLENICTEAWLKKLKSSNLPASRRWKVSSVPCKNGCTKWLLWIGSEAISFCGKLIRKIVNFSRLVWELGQCSITSKINLWADRSTSCCILMNKTVSQSSSKCEKKFRLVKETWSLSN